MGSFHPDSTVKSEYESLVAGDFSDGPRGRLLFVVSTDDLTLSRGDLYVGLGLAKYLRRLGWGITLWPTERWTEETPAGYDTAIVMIETFVPGLIHPDTRAIAWVRNWTERWARLPYLDAFAQLWCSSDASAERLREVYDGPVEVVPLATDHELFAPADVEREAAVVTTANFWGVNRGLTEALSILAKREKVTWFGKNARFLEIPEEIEHRHTIDYFSLPWVYSAWQFVIDDVIEAASVYGTLNSRLFDALACGAIVVTNTRNGLDELGLEDVPTYDSPQSLADRIEQLRSEPEELNRRAAALQEVVLRRHTYAVRAELVTGFLTAAVTRGVQRPALLAWTALMREEYRTEEFEHARLRTAYHEQYRELTEARDRIIDLETEAAAFRESRLHRLWRRWRYPGSRPPGTPDPRTP